MGLKFDKGMGWTTRNHVLMIEAYSSGYLNGPAGGRPNLDGIDEWLLADVEYAYEAGKEDAIKAMVRRPDACEPVSQQLALV